MRPSSGGSRRISKWFLPACACVAISTAIPASGTAAACAGTDALAVRPRHCRRRRGRASRPARRRRLCPRRVALGCRIRSAAGFAGVVVLRWRLAIPAGCDRTLPAPAVGERRGLAAGRSRPIWLRPCRHLLCRGGLAAWRAGSLGLGRQAASGRVASVAAWRQGRRCGGGQDAAVGPKRWWPPGAAARQARDRRIVASRRGGIRLGSALASGLSADLLVFVVSASSLPVTPRRLSRWCRVPRRPRQPGLAVGAVLGWRRASTFGRPACCRQLRSPDRPIGAVRAVAAAAAVVGGSCAVSSMSQTAWTARVRQRRRARRMGSAGKSWRQRNWDRTRRAAQGTSGYPPAFCNRRATPRQINIIISMA